MSAAFLAGKAALCKTVSLAHPSVTAELALMVDASAEQVDTSLHQRWQWAMPGDHLVFSQKNWSQLRPTTKGLTGSYGPASLASGTSAIFWWAGSLFLFTDRKPLTQALFRTSYPWTPR